MADTHKDLDYLRFFYASEDSLHDKDLLKNQAFRSYQRNVSLLMLAPALLQIGQITTMNHPGKVQTHRYIRNLKVFALMGAFAAVWNEKLNLEKKWRYYDRFYPEPTQLQRTLVQEAKMIQERDRLGITERSLEEKRVITPETRKTYEQMYQLPPQQFPEAEQDVNPASIKPHYGSS